MQQARAQYALDKAAYDKENEDNGGLGGGGVAAFESDMLAALRRCGGAGESRGWEDTRERGSSV